MGLLNDESTFKTMKLTDETIIDLFDILSIFNNFKQIVQSERTALRQ
jgi:hypothetical protein